jgi:cytochrome c peroxidase
VSIRLSIAAFLLILAGCGPNRTQAVARPVGKPVEIAAPLGLPPVPLSEENMPTAETIALGRRLFSEPKLSSGDKLSCASCHNPKIGFSDGRRFSVGASGATGKRNAPTILNSAYAPSQFWDGRAPSLEEQVGGPMSNPIEMNQSHEISVAKLQADPAYRADFERAFGPGPITISKVKSAIASFERTLISGNSPFDRYQYGNDKTALSPAAIRGLEVFINHEKGNCAACHAVGPRDALFTDGQFHNIGVGVNESGELTDLGRYDETKYDRDKGAFKTPSLRNVALTAPYMHDGSLKTLKAVVDFYVGGANSNPYLDREIKPLNLTAQEKSDLISFLESLTGEPPAFKDLAHK